MSYIKNELVPGYTGVFVIQDHRATNRHWDLRLSFPVEDVSKALGEYAEKRPSGPEPAGKGKGKGLVLRSWAIPKHRLPTDKPLLASETEDHAYSYRLFSGAIPEGMYGAGTVEIYDHGTYKLLDVDYDKKYVFSLKGKKIQGTYALIKTGGKQFLWTKVKNTDKYKLSSSLRTLAASIIDLPRQTLPQRLWDLSKDPPALLPDIRSAILNALSGALEGHDLLRPFRWISGLFISGSCTGNAYKENGDLDIDITYQPEDIKKFYPDLARLTDNDIQEHLKEVIYPINTEKVGSTPFTFSFMVLPPGDMPISDGVYDILNGRWLKGPQLIPVDFDPDRAFIKQRVMAEFIARKIDLLIGYILRIIRDIKTLDIYIANNGPKPDKRTAMLRALERACRGLDTWYRRIWSLSESVRDSGSRDFYPAYRFSKNWEERNVIFKYLSDRGYHKCVSMLYGRLKGDPYLDLVDKFITD